MKKDNTQRGFDIYKFDDLYREKCSLQKSSLATQDAIWLGQDNVRAKKLVYGKGWVDVELPEGVEILGGRMHLSQDQVKKLLPILQKFAETGDI